MEYIVISVVAFIVAGLTFFSGFGLGTLLMPTFAIFFPVELAIAATAVVHLLNNIFKVILIGRHAHLKTVLLFAIPAAIFAALGAWLLNYLSALPSLFQYSLAGHQLTVTPVKLIVAILMVVFAIVELAPYLNKLSIGPKMIPVGGSLSGFFGGVSGHQGALRTAFLMRAGLNKKTLLGTMVVSSVVVDVSRLIIYGLTFFQQHFSALAQQGGIGLVIAGSAAAFVGSFIGSRLLEKITLKTLKYAIAVMLLIIAAVLGMGII